MVLNHKKYYRLPWSISDNVFSWLEPTKECNIYCEGCYSENSPGSHKTLAQIRGELDALSAVRQCDAVCIAGGEPLLHPQLEQIVALVAERGYKALLNTNALAMTEDMMRRLKAAGLKKFSFHIDSYQRRPGWTGKSEAQLNELRLAMARMTEKVGGLYCSFNTTVYPDTLKDVPQLLKWAQQHIAIVHGMNFIIFRSAQDRFEYYAGKTKISLPQTVRGPAVDGGLDISVGDVVAEIRRDYPAYEPCAYLNAFETPDIFRWLFTIRLGTSDAIYGYLGPKVMEMAQGLYHFLAGRYLGPVDAATHAAAKWQFLAAVIDKGAARALFRYLCAGLLRPVTFFRPVYMQIVTILNPAYNLPDGRQAMCDGCPDMTPWNGQLVCSCRLDELKRYGCFLSARPVSKSSNV
ncbi:MAG: hypothetical protein A2234_08910 [Elusimicrobia bacterium RIFOXYA2_FULL_58_8]|nr:MAG: hypothetical protein A2285_01695 [Elusimicrobia bacterium RIFOXYA12_FULL_57_11]OGS15084.1 MAG: hypothetical protein A2234_08910 [Elusimicrobia bacterium RIFOXYA2_FULL_58_8]